LSKDMCFDPLVHYFIFFILHRGSTDRGSGMRKIEFRSSQSSIVAFRDPLWRMDDALILCFILFDKRDFP